MKKLNSIKDKLNQAGDTLIRIINKAKEAVQGKKTVATIKVTTRRILR